MIGVNGAFHEKEISECGSKNDKGYARKETQHDTNSGDLQDVENQP